MKRLSKLLACALACMALACVMAGCGSTSSTGASAATSTASSAASAVATSAIPKDTATSAASAASTAETTTSNTAPDGTVRVGSLKGPTSIGIVDLMRASDAGETAYTYDFTIATQPDEIVSSFISGDIDIAMIPANLASVLYNRTDGATCVIDINTLGVLECVTGDTSITSLADLAGHTVYMTDSGKGATPEYVMNYLLEDIGIADQVTLEFKSSDEIVSMLSSDASIVSVLPQPYATVAQTKVEGLATAFTLNDSWAASTAGEAGSQLITGVTVVRSQFMSEQPEAVAEFVVQHAASVEAVNADPTSAGELVAQYGIIDSATVAAKAIPNCALVCITGDEMQQALSGYLDVLWAQDESSVGGSVPDEDFYLII